MILLTPLVHLSDPCAGNTDTSLYCSGCYPFPNVFQNVVSQDGFSAFWTSGSQFQSQDQASPTPAAVTASTTGVQYVLPSGSATSVYGSAPVKALNVFNDTSSGATSLYVAKPRIIAVTGDTAFGRLGFLPSTTTATSLTLTPYNVAAPYQACQATFEVGNYNIRAAIFFPLLFEVIRASAELHQFMGQRLRRGHVHLHHHNDANLHGLRGQRRLRLLHEDVHVSIGRLPDHSLLLLHTCDNLHLRKQRW
jgi:hypothetical protein